MELSSKSVEVSIGDSKILKGIDIQVNNREFVGIIGPNGSGKSTFLKTVYRVLRNYEGSVFLNNKDIKTYSFKDSAKSLGVVSQHNNYNFDFKVIDMVLMGRYPHKKFIEGNNKEDYEIARKSLEEVGMIDYIDRSFSSLSGGESQRVILARALAQKAKCLILDEPTNHLDIQYQFEIMDILKSLNITVLAVIHDLNIAAIYCDKIYAIDEGKVISCGTPKEVLTKDLIKKLYNMDCNIIEDKVTKGINIIYRPKYVTKNTHDVT